MKKSNKLLSLILTVCMILSLLPMGAQAAGAPYTISTGTVYLTLSETLANASDGATITLLGDITESVSYAVYADKTVTIDGGGYTLTGTAATNAALALNGTGMVKLKDLTVQGGASASGTSTGLEVSGSVSVQSYGTVSAKGGTVMSSRGVTNSGTGTVDVTEAVAEGSAGGVGAYNTGSGTINVRIATGSGAMVGAGAQNDGGGTINVMTASANRSGVANLSSGTVNVTTATNTDACDPLGSAVKNEGAGTVNAGTAVGALHGVNNITTGTVNAGTITGDTQGTGINTGTAVTVIPLHVGTGASCVLDSITIAAAGTTTIGTLPGVYKAGVYSNSWYTDSDLSNQFLMQEVSSEATLYSSLNTPEKISTAAISGVTVPVTGATPVANIADTTQYTATISWSPAAATFAAGTAYTATITISPKTGYTLTGVPANFFTVAGATTTNAADSGVLTAVFPATAATAAAINTPVIAGVTAPVTSAAPASAIADTTEYTATISWLPAAAIFAAGTAYTATITISPKTGYTLTGVPANFFTVSGATATNAANSGVITAIFPATAAASSGGGGSSSGSTSSSAPTPTTTSAPTTTITESPQTGQGTPSVTGTTPVDAKDDGKGKAAASVTEIQVTDALNKALAEAAKKGGNTDARVDIKVTAPANAASVETAIPKTAVDAVAGSQAVALSVSTPLATLSFDRNSLNTISKAAEDVKISVSKVDTTALSEETKQIVGDRPVYNFSVTSGDKTISQFGGTVTVSVPYTPKAGEDTNAIVIYYINAAGKAEMVKDCVYNQATGMITFKTNHFSKYAMGYNKVRFIDVDSTSWYSDAVSFVAAREITTGTGNGNFSPETKLTRGQFLVMVMKTYGISADESLQDNFSDAGNTYYTGYLASAKKLGITTGIGDNSFAPDKQITRQEMSTLLYNALKQIGELPTGTTGKTLTSYNDANEVASWAKDAVSLFTRAGVISGNDNSSISPADTTTRAQMAQILYNLISK